MSLKHPDGLRSALCAALSELCKKEPRARLDLIEVAFVVGRDKYWFTLDQALDNIENDIFWDQRGNWSEANIVEIRTI